MEAIATGNKKLLVTKGIASRLEAIAARSIIGQYLWTPKGDPNCGLPNSQIDSSCVSGFGVHQLGANGRLVHRKGFAKTYSTNIVEGAGHS